MYLDFMMLVSVCLGGGREGETKERGGRERRKRERERRESV
jgi:hypothetical protein